MIYRINNSTESTHIPGITCFREGSKVRLSYDSPYMTSKFLYFYTGDDGLTMSFDFFGLAKELSATGIIPEPNKNIFNFFTDRGYAPFDNTIITQIKKLPNLCTVSVDLKELTVTYRIDKRETGKKKDTEVIKDAVRKCLRKDVDNVILFSGGYDSSLIASLAARSADGYRIELATGGYEGTDFLPNRMDLEYSGKLADKFGLPFTVIKYDVDKASKEDFGTIIYKQPNTAHFSLGYNHINKHFEGRKVNFISGQQADSILNFGSTSFFKINGLKPEGLGELLRRFVYLSGPAWTRSAFRLMNNNLSKDSPLPQLSLLCGYKKFPKISDGGKYEDYKNLYRDYLSKLENPELIINNNHVFYISTFMSGSDASSIANIFDSSGYPMPFNELDLVWHFANKKYSFRDKYVPKRPVMDLLRKDREIWDLLSSRPNTPNLSYETVFYTISERLGLDKEFAASAPKYGLDGQMFNYNSYHLSVCFDRIYE